MERISITAIQYCISGNTKEERRKNAIDFVKATLPGTRMFLRPEPDNIYDRNAVAVYCGLGKIGYVANEQTYLIHRLLGGKRHLEIRTSGGDNHLTLFFNIDESVCSMEEAVSQNRKIALSPLDKSVFMPFLEADHELQYLMDMLLTEDFGESNIEELFTYAEAYVPLAKLTICREDCINQRLILKLLDGKLRSFKSITKEQHDRLAKARSDVRDVIGDVHREGGHLDILSQHLARLKDEAGKHNGFFSIYDMFYFRKPIEEASYDEISNERHRLKEWLEKLPGGIFRPENPELAFVADKLCYLSLSREELYDVMGVMLIVERLDVFLNNKISDDKCREMDNESKDVEELFHFVHPKIEEEEHRKIHNEIKRLVKQKGRPVSDICDYLLEMAKEKRVLLPRAKVVYDELARLGMPINDDGYNFKTFSNYYKKE
ncbi:MAG: HIRAN domain-containing protein [Prevotella sp.]